MSDHDTLTVSANEVLRTVEWILRGRGIDCGNEDAAAHAATWLALAYPGALAGLLSELAVVGAVAPLAPLSLERVNRRAVIDAGGASALLVFPLVLDWLAAIDWPGDVEVDLKRLASPLWCLGHLARLDGAPALRVVARDSDGACAIVARRAANARVDAALAESTAIWGRCFDTTIERSGEPLDERGYAERLSADRLSEMRRRALASGIRVSSCDWQALSAHAYEAFVPASVTSRERGAGGGDDNE